MDYLPTAEDLEEMLPEIVSGKGLGEIAEALHTSRHNLERLISTDPTAVSQMRELQAEMEALISLRLLTLVPKALDTLEIVMSGHVDNSKVAMAMVRAAESIADRNPVSAKVSRGAPTQTGTDVGAGGIPPLQEILSGVEEGDRMAVVDRVMAFVQEAEAIRKGDVLPKDVTPGEDDDREVRRGEIQSIRVVSEKKQGNSDTTQ